MAGERILFPDFRDEQTDSKYPFTDGALLRLTGTQLEIARDAFIDASLYPIGARGQIYISTIEITTFDVTITLGDAAETRRCAVTFNPSTPPEDGNLKFVDQYGRPAGIVLSTPLALSVFGGWPVGRYNLRPIDAAFVATVCVPAQEPGVRAILTEAEDFLTGDVWLIGNRGVVIRKESDTVIRFDIVGEPLFKRYLCEDQGKFTPPKFVKTINGCGPDEFGNFLLTATNHLAGDAVLRVYAENGILRIETVGRKVV